MQKKLNATGRRGWSTNDELAFLSALAAHRNAATKLRNYGDALRKRSDFGTLDVTAINSHLERLLSNAERNAVARPPLNAVSNRS